MEQELIPIVLIADDDPDILALISLRLSTAGFKVIQASNGEQALELVRVHFPDVVILDVMMPIKSGWEVAKALRQDARFKKVGIIVLTAIGETINEITSPLFGANAYLNKPFDLAELEAKVREVYASCQESLSTSISKSPA